MCPLKKASNPFDIILLGSECGHMTFCVDCDWSKQAKKPQKPPKPLNSISQIHLDHIPPGCQLKRMSDRRIYVKQRFVGSCSVPLPAKAFSQGLQDKYLVDGST